jgi:hypothetical protein
MKCGQPAVRELLTKVAGVNTASEVPADKIANVLAAIAAADNPAPAPARDTHTELAAIHDRVWHQWNHGWRRNDTP